MKNFKRVLQVILAIVTILVVITQIADVVMSLVIGIAAVAGCYTVCKDKPND
jgi:Co/Zn/Cd efflux system component